MKIKTPIYTTPEDFENGGLTLKIHPMLFLHNTSEKFENPTISVHFGFVFKEDSGKEKEINPDKLQKIIIRDIRTRNTYTF